VPAHPVYAAPTEKEALEEPRENITYFFERHQSSRARGSAATTPAAPTATRRGSRSSGDGLRRNPREARAFGTAARLKERLGGLASELGLDGFIVELTPADCFRWTACSGRCAS